MPSQARVGPIAAESAPAGGVQLPPSLEKAQQCLEHGIWYALSLWPALHVACQNSWGGEATLDKKDWFAGAVSDLFAQRTDTDAEDVEVFLLQIMQDEFDTNVEDDSEMEVARTILRLKKSLVEEHDLTAFKDLEQRWKTRGQMKVNVHIVQNEGHDEDGEEDWKGLDDDDDVDDDGDVNMAAAEEFVPDLVPALTSKRERPQPEVDEDGFTKIVGKKKR